MLKFLSCLVDRLAGLVLEIRGLLTVAIDVENPTCPPTSIEHCPHPIEADIKSHSLNPAIFNLTEDTFRLIFEHLDPPDQICLSLSWEPLYNLFRPLLERRNGALAAFFDREGHGRAELLVRLQGLQWLLCTVRMKLHWRDQLCQLPRGWKGRCIFRGSVKRLHPGK